MKETPCGVDAGLKFHRELFDRVDETKRRRILRAATAEFAGKGFERANINRVAAKAGVSVGSLYKYFGTKKNLFHYLIRLGVAQLRLILHDIEVKDDTPLIGRVEAVLRAVLATSRENKDLIRLYLEIGAASTGSSALALALDIEKPSAQVYTRLIAAAQKKGEARSDLAPGFLAFLLDNLFTSLQFACSGDYYKARCRVFTGSPVYDNERAFVEQSLAFIQSAIAPVEREKKARGQGAPRSKRPKS